MARPFTYRWRDAVAESSTLTLGERAVAWRLADYADPDGGSIRPGHARLAREVGYRVSPDATKHDVVGRTIRRLLDLGFLDLVSSGHRGHAAVYRLRLPPR